MKSKKYNGKCLDCGGKVTKANWGTAFGFSPSMQRGFSMGQYMQTGQEQQIPQLQQAPMQQMPVDMQQPQMQAFNPVQQSVINPPQRQQRRPFSITTPGSGDVIAGAVGIANALMPQQEQYPSYHVPRFGSYNPYSQGTGSQAIYEEGGELPEGKSGFKLNPKHKGWCTPMTKSTCTGKRRQFAINAKNHFKKGEEGMSFPGGVTTKTRKQGGFTVTEEVPNNLGYGIEPIVQPTVPMLPTQQLVQPKSIGYEKLNTQVNDGGREVFLPKFQGNWTRGEINNYWNNIPQKIGDKEVLRGQAWEDLQNTSPSMARENPHNRFVNQVYQQANWPAGYFDLNYRNRTMQHGGKLSAGQTITLSSEEKAYYEARGYKFK